MAITPAVFAGSGDGGAIAQIEDNAAALNDKLNPFANAQDGENGQIPFYVTGGRALIRIGGKPMGVAQRVRWNIAYNTTPIATIDAAHPWDIDVGQVSVTAELAQVMDPTKGPEHDALFHIMQAAIHQPMVEMQILDRGFGTQYFFTRGMFTEINGNVGTQAIGGWQAKFIGVSYQHYVNQQFKPYTGVAGAAGALIDGLQNIASDLSGGIL